MDVEFVEADGFVVARMAADGGRIDTARDAVDLIGNASYGGAGHVLLLERDLGPGFFDLTTGSAGEILQKFANHRMKLVIVCDVDAIPSASARALVHECNRGRQVAFVPDEEGAFATIARWGASV